MILYLLNWNLFARHKDSLAESTSCSTAEIVQKMDRVPFVCWPILFHGGASEGHRMSSCSNLRELCTCSARRSDSQSSGRGWGLSEPALKASEVTVTEPSARSPDPSCQHLISTTGNMHITQGWNGRLFRKMLPTLTKIKS